MQNGATAGFKYFSFDGTETMITVQGRGNAAFTVTDGKNTVAIVSMNQSAAFSIAPGVHPLYFTYEGNDAADFVSFTIM